MRKFGGESQVVVPESLLPRAWSCTIHTSKSIQALPEGHPVAACTAKHLLRAHCARKGLGAAAAPLGMHGQNQIEESLT